MPPEPLPWERKDYFKDHRKHDGLGGSRGGSSSSAPRWREPYHGPRDFARASPRRPPPGHHRQGGFYHPVYSEDSGGHGCTPPRSDRFWAEDDSFRSSSSGRYGGGRSGGGRDNRGSFQRSPLWDSGDFSRQHHEPHVTGPRSVAVPISSASQPPLKDQNDKTGGVINDGLATGHRFYNRDRASWKPSMKWSRHGSSSSTKGDRSDTEDARLEVAVPPGKVTPVQSPVSSPLPSEDDGPPKKKPRLGWGQGLAKYEKQKVEGPSHVSESAVVRDLNDTRIKVSGPPVSVSPATPCSATCSSSIEEKSGIQSLSGDRDKCYKCNLPGGLPDDIPIKLDHLGTNPATALTSILSDLLQPDDIFSADLTFTKYPSLNKLLMLKEDISKELEKIECEIDLSENELKALACDAGNHLSIVTKPTMSSSGTREEHCNESHDSSKWDHVNIGSTTDMISMKNSHHCGNSNKESDIQIINMVNVEPQTLLPRAIQSTSLVKDVSDACLKNVDKCSISLQVESSRVVGAQHISLKDGKERQLTLCENEEVICSGHNNSTNETLGTNTSTHTGSNMIVSATAAKKYAFTEASLTPSDIWESVNLFSCRENDLNIRERLVFRKRLVNFKERILTLKFRALHHLWEEDLRLLSLRKHRPKSNKRFELGGRLLQSGSQKQRSSIKTSFVLPGNMSLTPTNEIVKFATTLLSDSRMKLYRSNLKMPALILDDKERFHMRFVTHNALVEDPLSFEKEKSLINPWSQEEKEVFMEMLVKYGKDFTKISSYLHHKTTADCIEFYYKNHKSEMFREVKERLDLRKQQQKLPASTYLGTSGKKWNPEANAAAVDLNGASSAVASQNHVSAKSKKNYAGKTGYGVHHDWKVCSGSHNGLDSTNSIEELGHEESLFMCCALSSEAVSSCVTNSSDPAGKLNHMEDPSNKAESLQHFDEDTFPDEGFMELHSNDWSDEEKSIFIQAFGAYGKDFARISSCVKSRSREQCKIFYSKARKCLSLDLIHHDPDSNVPLNDKHEGRSDTDDAGGTEIDSAVCSVQSCSKLDENISRAIINTSSQVVIHNENILPRPEVDGTSKQGSVGEVKLDIVNKIDSEQVTVSHNDMSVDEQNCSQYSISSKGKAENILPCNETKDEFVTAVYVDPEIKMKCCIDDKAMKVESTQGSYIAQTRDICLNAPVIVVQMEVESKPLTVVQNELMNKQRGNIDFTEATDGLHGFTVDSNMNNVDRSSQITIVPNYQHQTQLDLLHSLPKKAISFSVKEETADAMLFNSFFPDQSSICFGNKLNVSPQSSLSFEEHNGVRHHNVARDPYQQYMDITQPANQVNRQLHILGSSPLQMLNHEIERETCQISKKPVLLETYSRRNGGSRSNISFLSDMSGHSGGMSSIPSSRSGKQCPRKSESSQSESQLKPCVKRSSGKEEHKSGDVKLFGTILSQASSVQKSNSSAPECSKKSPSPVPNGSSLISSPTAGGSALGLENGRNKGLEDHPFSTYGFWDGNRIQTGLTSMPEASALFSRYQGTLPGSYYPAKDAIPSSNRNLKDCQQSFMQHLTSDGNRVESLSNIQNGFEMVSSFWQQQGKLTRRMDGVGGVPVGSGEVSDPVAALKLHYAAEQAKVLSSEMDSWRTNIGDR